MNRTRFLNKSLWIIVLAIFITYSCQEEPIEVETLVEVVSPGVLKSTNPLLWTKDNNFVTPENPPQPEKSFTYYPEPNWTYEDGQFVATGSIYATTWDDYVSDNNCAAWVQILLVKDGEVYNNHATEIVQELGDYAVSAEIEKKWYFPATTDLSNVYIVAQGYVQGCFGTPKGGKGDEHSIFWVDYKQQVFNATIHEDPPTTPSNLSIGTNGVSLSWDASQNADFYEIFRKVDYNWFILLATTSSTNYFDNSVIPYPQNNTFYYRVRAGNSVGYSYYSNTVSIMGNTWD